MSSIPRSLSFNSILRLRLEFTFDSKYLPTTICCEYGCPRWFLNGNKNRAWNVKVHLLIITRCVQCSRSVDEIPGRGVSSAFLATYERLSCRAASLSFCYSTAFSARSIVLEINRRCYRNRFSFFLFFRKKNNRTNHERKVGFV